MTYQLNKRILASEKRVAPTARKASLPLVVVCYPNSYGVGMSNLGLHFLLSAFSASSVRVERAFALPQIWKNKAVTFESGRTIAKASLLLATISFENDYINFLAMLRAASIPLKAEDRGDADPVVIAGGGALSSNPTVIAPFCDAVALGELDESIKDFSDASVSYAQGGISRREFLRVLRDHPNFLDPHLEKTKGGPGIASMARTARAFTPVSTEIVSPYAHFANTVLIELNRSCVSSCRFCVAGCLYKPFRTAKRDAVLELCSRWQGRASSIGLIGTSVESYPGFASLCDEIRSMGFSVKLSSLRLEGLKESTLKLIADLGIKTITLAPETASDVLRRSLLKGITNDEIEEKLSMIATLPISKIKLYFMYALPGESDGDIEVLPGFIQRARKRLRNKRLQLSINALIPKAWTPLQWFGMPERSQIEKKRELIISIIRKNLKETPALASSTSVIFQAVLSLGGSELAFALAGAEQSRSAIVRNWTASGLDLENLINKEKPFSYVFPWDKIDTGINKADLYEEYEHLKSILAE
jgi:radical SAM superfamily enzyme YgiQ (UPF0313 family)